MTYDELIKVVRSCPYEEGHWLYNGEKGIFTLRSDLDIRIQRGAGDAEDRGFHEPWATKHQDPNAYRVFYEIYYRASIVKEFMLVGVDGSRAEVPLPEFESNQISLEGYELARAVDTRRALDKYIERCGLTVSF